MDKRVCAFCGNDETRVKKLIKGKDDTYICDECVSLCGEILEEVFEDEKDKSNPNPEKLTMANLPKPKKIKEFLDEYVISQDDAKKTLSVAIYNHYKRILNNDRKGKKVNIEKSNILMAGPTGCGKTYIIQTIARMLNVPLAISDASSLTCSGYVGNDVCSVVRDLYVAAGEDIEKMKHGIIYIDEIDKIARQNANRSITKDVSGESVQQELLKIIEGSPVSFPKDGGRKNPNGPNITVDTTDILFIVGGSFEGLEKIIAKRRAASSMGFRSSIINGKMADEDNFNIFEHVTPEDFVKFGMLPEFCGRVPVICKLSKLTRDEIRRIITEPKNSLADQYKTYFEMDDIELDISDEAYNEIADNAIRKDVGARGIRTMLETILRDAMFELPGSDIDKFQVTKELVEEKLLLNGDIDTESMN